MTYTKEPLNRIIVVTGWIAACLLLIGSLHAQPATEFLSAAPAADGELVVDDKRWVLAESGTRVSSAAAITQDSSFEAIKQFADLRLLVNRNSKVPSQPLITLYTMHKTPPLPGQKRNWVELPLTPDRLFPRNANIKVWKDGAPLWADLDPGYNNRQSSSETMQLVPGTGFISSSPSVYFTTNADDDGEAILLPRENTTSPLGQPGTYRFVVELINPANPKDRITSNVVALQLP